MAYGRGGGYGRRQQRDDRGRIVLWENDRAETDKSPQFVGKYTDEDGNEFQVSLWERRDGGGNNPVFTGRIEEKRERSDGNRSSRYGRGAGGDGRRYRDDRGPPEDREPRDRPPRQRDLNDEIPF